MKSEFSSSISSVRNHLFQLLLFLDIRQGEELLSVPKILKTLIFKSLYLSKVSPIFVGSTFLHLEKNRLNLATCRQKLNWAIFYTIKRYSTTKVILTTDFKRPNKTVVSLGPFIKDVGNLEGGGR